MTSDLDLLRQFAREHSQDAFAEIVRRHINLVYSAALRQVRSPQLAEEVAQSVFTDLARNAGKFACGGDASSPKILTPWLYSVTRRTAIDVIRKESRRQLREQIAAEMQTMNATAEDWTQIAPLLDDAMAALDETDRAAILLRYFENKNLREVGEQLKISDDAAQKRVSRAVEKLREFFSKQKITIGASGLVVLISANAVQSAPVGLSATILATTSGITATIGITMIHKILITGFTAAAIGSGIYSFHLQKQIGALQQQQTSLNQQLAQLSSERDDAKNQLAALQRENEQLKGNENELLKLRGEVARLRNQQNVSQEPSQLKINDTTLTLKIDPETFIKNVKACAEATMHLSSDPWSDIFGEILNIARIDNHPPHDVIFNAKDGTIAMINTQEALKAFQQVVEALNRPDGNHLPAIVNTRSSVLIRSSLYKMDPIDFEQLNLGASTARTGPDESTWWMLESRDLNELKQRLNAAGFKKFQTANIQTLYGERANFFTGGLGKGLEFDFLPTRPMNAPFDQDMVEFKAQVSTTGEFSSDPAGDWPVFAGRTNCAVFAKAVAENGGGLVFRAENCTDGVTNDLIIVSEINANLNTP